MRKRFITTIDVLLKCSGVTATLLLLMLVAVIGYNVIARYMFNNSSIGLEELGWHFYAAIFLLAIPYAVHTDSHVRIDLIYEGRSDKYKRLIGIFGTMIFLLPFSAITCYYGWVFTAQAMSYGTPAETLPELWQQFVTTGIGEKSQDPGGLTNRFIIKGVIPLSSFLLFLAGISKLLKLTEPETNQFQ